MVIVIMTMTVVKTEAPPELPKSYLSLKTKSPFNPGLGYMKLTNSRHHLDPSYSDNRRLSNFSNGFPRVLGTLILSIPITVTKNTHFRKHMTC